MRIAIIGQSLFAANVSKLLIENGYTVCGIFTIQDKNGREDALATYAKEQGLPLFKIARWRNKDKVLEKDVFEQYLSTKPDLNVLPYCSQFIPMDVINYPKHQSIIYHPSILPRHRGASAINWTLIEGDLNAGFTIFWADDGLDTGPILLQKQTKIQIDDTVDSLYNRFLYPEGIKSMVEAVKLIDTNSAPRITQTEEGATYDAMLNKKALQQLPLDKKLTALQIHDFIRGMDKVPGAWVVIDGKEYRLYSSRLVLDPNFYDNYRLFEQDKLTADRIREEGGNLDDVIGRKVSIQGEYRASYVSGQGLVIFGTDNKAVVVGKLKNIETGKMMNASTYGLANANVEIELTESEQEFKSALQGIWCAILGIESKDEIVDALNFFECGAGSMDVTRLVEEIKEILPVNLVNEDVYMAPEFGELVNLVVIKTRDGDSSVVEVPFEGIEAEMKKKTVRIPTQLFINNEFVNSSVRNSTTKVINPTNEEVIGLVQRASKFDVTKAVNAAYNAFHHGDWSKMNARDRGKLLNRLADLMEEHKEELAFIESIDSGAVYTLAIKTHVGMSIDAFRYYAGWCDKIHGKTIPINSNRPNKNLCFTRREPFGVCGLITPWNYPLMMAAWKMSSALAAGNCVVLKPPAVCPLTCLKLGELIVKAGFPPGVVNILSGSGAEIGDLLSRNDLVRKLAFTGSTEVGKIIMQACGASNLKKVTLELGGKSPLVIFDDCDMERAVKNALQSVFFNKGENCIAAGRIFIQENIHDEFVKRLINETSKMKIGDPLDRSTAHGPQNHKAHLDKLLEYIDIGKKEGAKLVYGGKRVARPGYFLEPTIFTDVLDGTYLAKEESFGPVMCISKFRHLEEVVSRANDNYYGLASGVFTNDINKAMQFSERIEAGTCFINCYNKTDVAAPFGGFKQSGFGKDLGEDSLNEYLKTKTVTMEY